MGLAKTFKGLARQSGQRSTQPQKVLGNASELPMGNRAVGLRRL